MKSAPIRRVLLLVALSFVALACAKRATQTTAAPVVRPVLLRVTNNLGEPLTLSAQSGTAPLWSGNVAARSQVEGMLGTLPVNALISLRATNARGTIVSLRDSVGTGTGVMIWIIP